VSRLARVATCSAGGVGAPCTFQAQARKTTSCRPSTPTSLAPPHPALVAEQHLAAVRRFAQLARHLAGQGGVTCCAQHA